MNQSTRKDEAMKMRLSGGSYNDILKTLGIPKSTLSTWFSGMILPKKVASMIDSRGKKKATTFLLERNKRQTILAQERSRKYLTEGMKNFPKLGADGLLLIGTSLYWAEGYKRIKVRNGRKITSHAVSLTNADPFLQKLFIRFLLESCHVAVERIRVGIRIFPHQNRARVLEYWVTQLGLPRENFTSLVVVSSISSKGLKSYNTLEYGVAQVNVSSTELFYTIMGYIEGLKKLV